MHVDLYEEASVPNVRKAIPFKGPRSYEEIDAYTFYGREQEISTLFQLIRVNVLTVLFSQSGVGKSSLLRAGIMPTLRRNDYLPVYIRPDYGNSKQDFFEFIVDQIDVSIHKMSQESINARYKYNYEKPKEGETLYEYLNRAPFYRYTSINGSEKISNIDKISASDLNRLAYMSPLIPVLIFDQFEEIFTIGGSNARLYDFMKNDLSYIIENNIPPEVYSKINQLGPENAEIKFKEFNYSNPGFRIVFALREEYLSHLESLSREMPSILYNNSKLRLTPFTSSVAQDVILRISEFEFTHGITEKIVRLISERKHETGRRKDEVEPFLLSLVCFHLYLQIIENDPLTINSISRLDFDLVDKILEDYYQGSLAGMDEKVKIFVEEELLTDKGNRTLHDADDAEKIIGKAALDKLVNEVRLLRKEEFLNSQHLEIIHDRLTPVIIKSREQRRKNERDLAEAAEAKKNEIQHLKKMNEERKRQEDENRQIFLAAQIEQAEQLKKKSLELEAELRREHEIKLAEAKLSTTKELNDAFSLKIQQIQNAQIDKERQWEREKESDIQQRLEQERSKFNVEREEFIKKLDRTHEEFRELEYSKTQLEKEFINSRSVLRNRYIISSLAACICLAVAIILFYIWKADSKILVQEIALLKNDKDDLTRKLNYSSVSNNSKSWLADSLKMAASINSLESSIARLQSTSNTDDNLESTLRDVTTERNILENENARIKKELDNNNLRLSAYSVVLSDIEQVLEFTDSLMDRDIIYLNQYDPKKVIQNMTYDMDQLTSYFGRADSIIKRNIKLGSNLNKAEMSELRAHFNIMDKNIISMDYSLNNFTAKEMPSFSKFLSEYQKSIGIALKKCNSFPGFK